MNNERVDNGLEQQKDKSEVKQAVSEVKDTAGETAEQAKEQAQQLAGQAKDEARSTLSRQKDTAAGELHGVAHAIRQTSTQLRQQDQEMFAEYSSQMADQVERASSYLEEHNLDDLLSDAQRFARKQPELFLGGAFTLGLLAARFLKSSAPSYQQASAYSPTRYTQTTALDNPTGPRYGTPSSGPITGESKS